MQILYIKNLLTRIYLFSNFILSPILKDKLKDSNLTQTSNEIINEIRRIF
jgi:hypothetical protein